MYLFQAAVDIVSKEKGRSGEAEAGIESYSIHRSHNNSVPSLTHFDALHGCEEMAATHKP